MKYLFHNDIVWPKSLIEKLEEHSRLISIDPDAEQNTHEKQHNLPHRYELVCVVARMIQLFF